MAVVRSRRSGDGFAVSDFRFVREDFQVEARFKTFLHDVEMELAHAGDDEFLGLGVARHLEGRVFIGDLVQAAGDLLLVAARLRFDREAEHRQGILRQRQLIALPRIPAEVADSHRTMLLLMLR